MHVHIQHVYFVPCSDFSVVDFLLTFVAQTFMMLITNNYNCIHGLWNVKIIQTILSVIKFYVTIQNHFRIYLFAIHPV